jgi:4-amino-4-deoxy-L-arabinose transferase-like glycosyltransferase
MAATIAWSDDLLRDPDAYGGLAARLLAGLGFVAPDGHATAFRPPLYPILLAAVLPGGTLGIAVLQIALGVATVALTVVIGSRIGLGRIALLAGLFVAVDPLLLRYTPQIMTEVTCTFLASLLLWAGVIVQARMCDDAACRKRTGLAAFYLGVLFGVAVLSRPTFWAWGVLVALAWIVRIARDPSHMKSRLIASVCVGAGVLLAIAPWAIRNAAALGEPVVTTTHGGYTLLLANNPVYWKEVVLAPAATTWSGESLDAWQRSLEEEMAADGIAYDDELARDRWMKARAIEQIRHHPALFVRSGLYRVSRLWDVVPAVPGSLPVRFAVGAFYVVTEALALAGLCWWAVRVWRADRGAAALTPAVLLIVAFTAVHFVYWSDARMRAPCVPAAALLAAFACSRILEGTRTRRSSVG